MVDANPDPVESYMIAWRQVRAFLKEEQYKESLELSTLDKKRAQLRALAASLGNGEDFQSNFESLSEEVRKLQALHDHKVRLWSREKFLSLGDTNSHYFLSRFITRCLRGRLSLLKLDNCNILTSQPDMTREVFDFFSHIYDKPDESSESLAERSKMLKVVLPVISHPQQDALKRKEVQTVILAGGVSLDVSALADNTAVFLTLYQDSFRRFLELLSRFQMVSGAKVNYRKSKILLIGKYIKPHDWLLNLPFQVLGRFQATKYLGVTVATELRPQHAWAHAISAIEGRVHSLVDRNLSFEGRCITLRGAAFFRRLGLVWQDLRKFFGWRPPGISIPGQTPFRQGLELLRKADFLSHDEFLEACSLPDSHLPWASFLDFCSGGDDVHQPLLIKLRSVRTFSGSFQMQPAEWKILPPVSLYPGWSLLCCYTFSSCENGHLLIACASFLLLLEEEMRVIVRRRDEDSQLGGVLLSTAEVLLAQAKDASNKRKEFLKRAILPVLDDLPGIPDRNFQQYDRFFGTS
ncbi:hypothetical protein R1sor_021317 [Riccia sorocarpa]|uniref:Uncharacterized protein n=1 Tax=Riccia sorocarpa TaxID=122646 RepID=A0ABD3GID5_9MARC